MGPCQPTEHDFPLKEYGKKRRKFNVQWYKKYPNWLEYSIEKNRAYCLCCYLFRPCHGEQSGGDTFVGEGFNNWKNSEKLKIHVGGHDSAHNKAWRDLTAMKNQKQNIENIVSKRSEVSCNEYRTRLTAFVNCVRLLLEQGLSFCGDDEYETSPNQGNFLRVLRFLADHNLEVRSVTLGNANKNLKLTSPDIQKDIIHACASETVKAIYEDLGNALFSILVDESRDISMKEQMTVVLRYVDKRGIVVERFVGIEHVSSTTTLTLKKPIDKLLSRHKLSISRLRGQGYDEASNLKGQFNGLKTLILKENPCAFYIHYFAHQLQLALVYVAKKHVQVASFFGIVGSVLNTVGVSAKRCDILQDRQDSLIKEAIDSGELESGRGLNQQSSLKRFGDTRWGSHYGTLIRILSMYSAIVESLEIIIDDDTLNSDQRGDANNLFHLIQSFEFVFNLHLMIDVLGVTDELSKALQRKDQDIVNAMNLVRICKQRLQTMKQIWWDSLFDKVSTFCQVHNIDIPDMGGFFVEQNKGKRKAPKIRNMHRYRADLFYSVVDMQHLELDDRFTKVTTGLILSIAFLALDYLFISFDKTQLIQLAKYYPEDFSSEDLVALDAQLENYIIDMRSSEDFYNLKGIGILAKKIVDTKRNDVYPLVYRMITLALILPVATATVERVFSAMKIIKTRLRNRMGEHIMRDSM